MSDYIKRDDAYDLVLAIQERAGRGVYGDTFDWSDVLDSVRWGIDDIPSVSQAELIAINANRHAWETDVMRKAISYYGPNNQLEKLSEELGELVTATSRMKHRTKEQTEYENFQEERADVEIMLDQMKLIFQDAMDVRNIRAQKLSRLAERMEKDERG